MKLLRFDRTDFLLTRLMIAAVGVGVPLVSVGAPLVRWATGRALHWQVSGPDATTVPVDLATRAGVDARGTDSLGLRIDGAGTGTWLATLLPGIALSVSVVLGAWLLLRLVQSIELGQPFVAASAQALRLLSMIVLVGSLAVALCTGVADAVVTQRALRDVVSFGFTVPFVAVIAAFLILALAEAFAQGVRLQDDVEGLV